MDDQYLRLLEFLLVHHQMLEVHYQNLLPLVPELLPQVEPTFVP
jgi:hypothetical protein